MTPTFGDAIAFERNPPPSAPSACPPHSQPAPPCGLSGLDGARCEWEWWQEDEDDEEEEWWQEEEDEEEEEEEVPPSGPDDSAVSAVSTDRAEQGRTHAVSPPLCLLTHPHPECSPAATPPPTSTLPPPTSTPP